ncbi:hypothetical protein K8T06_12850, partial [bacterium]|nr:hypothetical protein [bacterium]
DQRAIAVKLNKFAGLLEKPTQENAVFADEFAGRIRVIACLDRMPNIIYPESTSADGINNGLWRKIRKRLKATLQDAILIVFGLDEDLETAINEIYIRAREAIQGVPSETRQALKNGSNDFERILPGPDRMYPDTDHPPIPIVDERVEKIKAELPEQPWLREKRYRQAGIPEDIVRNLAISSMAPLFDHLVDEYPDNCLRLSEIFGRMIKGLKRRGYNIEKIRSDEFISMVKLWKDGKLFREGFIPVLRCLSENSTITCSEAVSLLGMEPADESEISFEIEGAHKQEHERSFPDGKAQQKWMMGIVMKKLIGRVSGAYIADLIGK